MSIRIVSFTLAGVLVSLVLQGDYIQCASGRGGSYAAGGGAGTGSSESGYGVGRLSKGGKVALYVGVFGGLLIFACIFYGIKRHCCRNCVSNYDGPDLNAVPTFLCRSPITSPDIVNVTSHMTPQVTSCGTVQNNSFIQDGHGMTENEHHSDKVDNFIFSLPPPSYDELFETNSVSNIEHI